MRYSTVNSRLPGLLSFSIAGLLLSRCNPASQAPLQIGSNNWSGYQPLYLSQSPGYYQNNPIKPCQLSSTPEALQSLRYTNLANAALTLYSALTLIEGDFDLSDILPVVFPIGKDASLG